MNEEEDLDQEEGESPERNRSWLPKASKPKKKKVKLLSKAKRDRKRRAKQDRPKAVVAPMSRFLFQRKLQTKSRTSWCTVYRWTNRT